MPFEITASGPDIPEGTYPATLETVTEEQGQYGLMRKWTFLVEHSGKVEALTQMTSANTGLKAKSYEFLSALTGTQPRVGDRIEDPTGKKCLVQIVKNEKGFSKVEHCLPFSEPQQVLPGVPR